MKLHIKIVHVVLLAWFSLAVFGVSVGNTILTLRDYDFTTILFFGIYAVLVILFFLKESIFKYVNMVFCFLWLLGQMMNFFASPAGVANYNRIFHETHHIVPPSDTIAVPDTYHLILQSLIVLVFISLLAYCIKTHKKPAVTSAN
jgi:hypothetical protein